MALPIIVVVLSGSHESIQRLEGPRAKPVASKLRPARNNIRPALRCAPPPLRLLRTTRETSREQASSGAKQYPTLLAVRAAPFAHVGVRLNEWPELRRRAELPHPELHRSEPPSPDLAQPNLTQRNCVRLF